MIARIALTPGELRAGALTAGRQRLAVGLVEQHGSVALIGAVTPADRATWCAAPLVDGAVALRGKLAEPSLWASSFVVPLVRRLLGDDCVLAACALIEEGAALPRPAPLYPDVDDARLPCYAVRVWIPRQGDELVVVDHRADPPIPTGLELVYCRPWFREVERWRGRPPLAMSAADYARVPAPHRPLLSRIGSALAQLGIEPATVDRRDG